MAVEAATVVMVTHLKCKALFDSLPVGWAFAPTRALASQIEPSHLFLQIPCVVGVGTTSMVGPVVTLGGSGGRQQVAVRVARCCWLWSWWGW